QLVLAETAGNVAQQGIGRIHFAERTGEHLAAVEWHRARTARGGAHRYTGAADRALDLHADARDREVTGTRRPLAERGARPRPRLGHAHVDQYLVGRERGGEEPFEQVGRRDLSGAGRTVRADDRTARDEHARQP